MTIMNRKAVEFWGKCKAQPDLAYVEIDYARRRRVITWAEVMQARRERQRVRLEGKRRVVEYRAYKLWVAYFDQNLMGGWHAFLEDYRGDPYRVWVKADWLRSALMQAFPLILTLGSEREQWQQWMMAFAKTFERRRQHRQPLGVAYAWWDGRHSLREAKALPCQRQDRAAVGGRG